MSEYISKDIDIDFNSLKYNLYAVLGISEDIPCEDIKKNI